MSRKKSKDSDTPLSEPRKPRGRNYTASERALHRIGILAGVPLPEINLVLERDSVRLGLDPRLIPEGSHELVGKAYLDEVRSIEIVPSEVWKALWEQCINSKSLSDL